MKTARSRSARRIGLLGVALVVLALVVASTFLRERHRGDSSDFVQAPGPSSPPALVLTGGNDSQRESGSNSPDTPSGETDRVGTQCRVLCADPGGRPVVASVSLRSMAGLSALGQSDDEGFLALDFVPERSDSLFAEASAGGLVGELHLAQHSGSLRELVLLLKPAGSVEAVLPDSGGLGSFAGVDLFLMPEDGYVPRTADEFDRLPGPGYRRIREASGLVRIDGLLSGSSYKLFAASNRWVSPRGGLTLVADSHVVKAAAPRLALHEVRGCQIDVLAGGLSTLDCGYSNAITVLFGNLEGWSVLDSVAPPACWTGLGEGVREGFLSGNYLLMWQSRREYSGEVGAPAIVEVDVAALGHYGATQPVPLGHYGQDGFPTTQIELAPTDVRGYGEIFVHIPTGARMQSVDSRHKFGTLYLRDLNSGGRILVSVHAAMLPGFRVGCLPEGLYGVSFRPSGALADIELPAGSDVVAVVQSEPASIFVDLEAGCTFEFQPLMDGLAWNGPLWVLMTGGPFVDEGDGRVSEGVTVQMRWDRPPYIAYGVSAGSWRVRMGKPGARRVGQNAFSNVLIEPDGVSLLRSELHLVP
jgi:hypothetical protein